FDDITLSALGVSKSNQGGNDGDTTDLILADAVNALVHTVDSETQKPGFLAATNTGLFRSFDVGKGWQRLSYGPNQDPRTTCLSTNLREPNTIWAGTPQDFPVKTIVQDPQRPDYIYVGTKQSFYMSHDGGLSFTRRGGNLPFGDFTSILVNSRNGD